ncbi:MAG: LptF/LptG family permease [Flavobacteriaceae bacterium]
MKILDKYIIKNFIIPFLATFLVVLFVLVMLALWQAFDKIAGRGLSPEVIFKYLGYTSLMVTAEALPIGILLSSIMAMGNLSEHYEYAAIKSAGISLYRMLRPLAIFMMVLSMLNFVFLNYVFPYATYESMNLLVNMKKKEPAMALVAGSFNTDIPGYSIKFSEKYGEKNNLLKEVLIYDLTEKKYNNVVITAKYGEITSLPNSKYMTLILKDGHYYKDILEKGYRPIKDNMPFIKSHFKEHQINFDISNLDDFDDDKKIDQRKRMLNLKQLQDKAKSKRIPYQKHIANTNNKYFSDVKANKLHKDTVAENLSETSILANFTDKNKVKILKNATSSMKHVLTNLKSTKDGFKRKKLNINKYEVEYHNRISLSLSCLILFLIGAPLGSIIRKGGFGVPMIIAILIYVVYHFLRVISANMADTGKIPAIIGGWMPTIIMLPFGLFLVSRAVKDKGFVSFDVISKPIILFFKKINDRFGKKSKVI